MNRTRIVVLALCLTAASGITAPGVSAAAPASTAVTKQVKAGTTLTVRSGAGTSYAKVGSLMGGTAITGTPAGSWFKITTGHFAGRYVSGAYLVTSFDDAAVVAKPGQAVGYALADPTVNGSGVNVRSAPSFSATVVGQYRASTRVVGTPQSGGPWWKVSHGYIHSATLTTATSRPWTINAKIPTSQLCKIDPAFYSKLPPGVIGYGYTTSTPRYFSCKALPALNAMEDAYEARYGTYAGIDNAYRTWAEQAWWYSNYHTQFKVSPPGSSNHGYGLAVDFENDYARTGYPNRSGFTFDDFRPGHKGYNWLHQNAAHYGFAPIEDDAVHWNFVG